jgi:ATP-binding cassette subfamily F protein 3
MQLLKVHQASINLAGHQILNEVTLEINQGDRIGLVGPNGSGKSTLLKLILGELTPDSGTIIKMPNVTMGYLPQVVDYDSDQALIEFALKLPPKLAKVEETLTEIEKELAQPEVYENPGKLSRALERQAQALDDYETLEVARYQSQVREILSHFCFSPADFETSLKHLSGGQKKLLALTKLALEKPDILLLDEPDNHLDLSSKILLEKFLHQYKGAVVIVSHDRYLLDESVTKIAELTEGKTTLYVGNYSAYTTERELRRLRQEQKRAAQQQEIAKIEAAIKRFEHWARLVVDERHIKQARSRRKRLEKMAERGEIIEKVAEQKIMNIALDGWRGSTNALAIEDLTMMFDGEILFSDLDLLIRHGERIGLIGPNGAGKSVIFRLVLDELEPTEGGVKIGPSTRIGYYSQEQQTLTDWMDLTPLQLVRDTKPMTENTGVAKLIKFAFTYEQAHQKIRTLSGGEQSRLQLLRIMLQQPNFLLLDEPTNNLDIPSVEALEKSLDEFEGAILIISHDRYFLDQTVDEVYELKEGKLTNYKGGYTDYLEKTNQ